MSARQSLGGQARWDSPLPQAAFPRTRSQHVAQKRLVAHQSRPGSPQAPFAAASATTRLSMTSSQCAERNPTMPFHVLSAFDRLTTCAPSPCRSRRNRSVDLVSTILVSTAWHAQDKGASLRSSLACVYQVGHKLALG